MARQKRTPRSTKETPKKKPGPKKGSTKGVTKKPRTGKAVRKVAVIIPGHEQQLTTGIFKVWKHLKKNPTPAMINAARAGYVLTHDDIHPTRKELLAEIEALQISHQAMNTINSICVNHLAQYTGAINSWSTRKVKGRTIDIRKVKSAIPFVYISSSQQYEAEARINQAVRNYTKSFDTDE